MNHENGDTIHDMAEVKKHVCSRRPCLVACQETENWYRSENNVQGFICWKTTMKQSSHVVSEGSVWCSSLIKES